MPSRPLIPLLTFLMILTLVGAVVASPGVASLAQTPRVADPAKKAFQEPQGPIKHIVFLIKENRSFDNYFGTYPGADGATTAPTISGQIIPLKHQDDVILGIGHTSGDHQLAFNGGKMDGFQLIKVPENPGLSLTNPYANNSLTQFYQSDIPSYWAYAQAFVLGDRMFSSVAGPSYPNHVFTVAAQSGGAIDNPLRSRDALRGIDWGCEADSEQIKVWDQSQGIFVTRPNCPDFKTLADELYENDYSWRYYGPAKGGGGTGYKGYRWSILDIVSHIRFGPLWQYVVPVEQFTVDAQNGDLPTFSWLVPYARYSDHPDYSVCVGENWTVDVINSIMTGPDWNSTAIFIVWDEFGGLYDHVAPQQIDRFGTGFRVPLLVISPYARQGFVDHSNFEFSSVLRFAEDYLALSHLTERDARANNMMSAFDFSQTPRPPLILPHQECKSNATVGGEGWDFEN